MLDALLVVAVAVAILVAIAFLKTMESEQNKIKRDVLRYAKNHLISIDPSKWTLCPGNEGYLDRYYSIRIEEYTFKVGRNYLMFRYFSPEIHRDMEFYISGIFVKKLFNKVDAKYAKELKERIKGSKKQSESEIEMRKFLRDS